MVIVDVPIDAVFLTLSANVLLEVAGFGLIDAVTPAGSPLAFRATFLSKAFVGLMVIALVPLLPCATARVSGEAVRLKSPDGFTVRVMVVAALSLPDEPPMVRVTVPVAAVLLAFKVRTLVEVGCLGLKEAVTPFGRPETINPT